MGRRNSYYRRNSTRKGEIMKKILLSITLAMVASFAWGQTTRQPLMNERQVPQQPQRQTTTTQTTSTTDATGTITEYTPGSGEIKSQSGRSSPSPLCRDRSQHGCRSCGPRTGLIFKLVCLHRAFPFRRVSGRGKACFVQIFEEEDFDLLELRYSISYTFGKRTSGWPLQLSPLRP